MMSPSDDRYEKIIHLEDEVYEILDKLQIIKELKQELVPDHQ